MSLLTSYRRRAVKCLYKQWGPFLFTSLHLYRAVTQDSMYPRVQRNICDYHADDRNIRLMSYFVHIIKPSFKITQGIQRADRWGTLPLKTYLIYLYIYTYCSYIYMYIFSAMKKDGSLSNIHLQMTQIFDLNLHLVDLSQFLLFKHSNWTT